MASDPLAARRELRDRIAAKIREWSGGVYVTDADSLADAVVTLFYVVEDDWDRLDVRTRADGDSERWLWQRWLIARAPVQSVPFTLPYDRTVS